MSTMNRCSERFPRWLTKKRSVPLPETLSSFLSKRPLLLLHLVHAALSQTDHQEFVPAQPGHEVVPEQSSEYIRRMHQHGISHLMTICVIDFLKPVQVNVHQADRPAATVVMYVLVKTSAVIKSCKEICIRAVADLFLQIPLHCHIPEMQSLPAT